MSDWKNEIKSRFDAYIARQEEINEVLKELLKSLEVHPYNFATSMVFNDGEERSWTISIANKEVLITEKEITNSQLSYTEDLNSTEPLEEKGDLSESIIEVFLKKFKWTIAK
ncbi:hypothetical protein EHS13_21025 [Paenibacillus psychroresistens]|uniref:Uncharacterized protein n=1 Tax=Paenibacillus psychroresistens TaxID=1778678 RepID=A0A6B8RPE1_9BACL|nr:hypothetical protein [Paenibacillus psychroresistens]QGQ97188.1 hypothetical protein EHS13_21025 [Paenibacillus psychroresistens]